MDDEKLAKGILEGVGGRENIVSLVHCMTRLRIMVRSDDAVREDALKALDGVLRVSRGVRGYVEIVVGPGKSARCAQALRALGISEKNPGDAGPAAGNTGDSTLPAHGMKRILKVFGQIFSPLIPGILTAGICAGIASLIAQMVPGYQDRPAVNVICQLLSGVNAAFMVYLTAWAGYRAAEVFGGTPILGGILGMFTTLGNVDQIASSVGLYNDAQPLSSILRAGRGGVLAVLAGVLLMCVIEKQVRKRMPEALDVVFSPLLTLLISLVPYVLVIMPAIGLVSTGLCSLIEAVAMNPSPVVRMVAGFLGAALFLPMVAAGMHHGLIALYSVQLEKFGYVTLYPALAMAGAGQVGAALAIALKARKGKERTLLRNINGSLPAAVLGIGEPLIYSVMLPLGKPFITAGIGAGFGGAFVMLMQIGSTTWGPSGVLGAFVMTEGPKGPAVSVLCYLIGLAISAAAGFLVTALTLKEKDITGKIPEKTEEPENREPGKETA